MVAKQGAAMPIPKAIGFVWLGAKLPIWAADNIGRWRLGHLDYAINVYQDASMLLPRFKEMFHTARCIGDQAELLAFSILQECGGGWMLHVDTRPRFACCLDDLAEKHPITTSLLVPGVNEKRPDIWCMGASPECKAWAPINRLLVLQSKSDCWCARYGAMMFRVLEHTTEGLLTRAAVGEHMVHEAREGWRQHAIAGKAHKPGHQGQDDQSGHSDNTNETDPVGAEDRR